MKNKGFTLIELLVVIAIIGLLASAVLTSFPGAMQGARDGVRKQDLSTIRGALEEYWDIYGHYPTEGWWCDSSIGAAGAACPVTPPQDYWNISSDLQDLVAQKSFGKIPIDPINNSDYYYQYEPSGLGQGGCLVNACEWTLCCRLETTGANYCVYSVRNSDGFAEGGY